MNAVVAEPQSYLSRTYISSAHTVRRDELEIQGEEINEFSFFPKRVWWSGGYVVEMYDHLTISLWISGFINVGFTGVPHPYTLIYRTQTVSNRHIR